MNLHPTTFRLLAGLALAFTLLAGRQANATAPATLAVTYSSAASGLAATFNTASDVPVTASSYVASGSTVTFTLNFAPAVGTTLMVVNNTGMSFIQGTFDNLAQGQTVALSYGAATYEFVANYFGGTGNDLVLHWANTKVVAWGSDDTSMLGNNSTHDSYLPVPVDTTGALAGKVVIALAGGLGHSLILCSDGTVSACGGNIYGQLGHGGTYFSQVPAAVDTSGVLHGRTVIAIAAGAFHSLALCSDGALVAWGYNGHGELGNNSRVDSQVPVAVSMAGALSGKSVIAIAVGIYHCLALCSDGTVVAWGTNVYGELGNNGSKSASLVPVAVDTSGVLAGKAVIAVAAGSENSMALCSDGTLAAWGHNNYGQLGTNNTFDSPVPVAVDTSGVLSGKSVVAISAGSSHNLALCSDGMVAAWGYNHFGQLGAANITDSPVPVAVNSSGVLSGKTVIAVAGGFMHSLALCSDGTLAAWGDNAIGELGDNGTELVSTVPVAVSRTVPPTGLRFITAAAGSYSDHNFALIATPPPPRQTFAGNYAGLVRPQAGTSTGLSSEGFFTATLQASGAFSARLIIDGEAFGIIGVFDARGIARFGINRSASLTIQRPAKPSLIVSFTSNFFDTVTGTVTQSYGSSLTLVSIVTADIAWYNGRTTATTVPTAYLGNAGLSNGAFTVILPAKGLPYQPAGLTIADYPQGTGFGTLTLTKAGVFIFAGTLADGTTVTASAPLARHTSAPAITFPLFAQLYSKSGFLSATVTPNSADLDSDLSAASSGLLWARPASNSQYYPAGWPEVIVTDFLGAKYAAIPGQSVLSGLLAASHGGNALLDLEHGLLTSSFTRSVNLSKADVVAKLPATDKTFTLGLTRSTGHFSGIFTHTDGSKPKFQGVIYQKGSRAGGHGYFLTTTPKVRNGNGQSGVANLTAITP